MIQKEIAGIRTFEHGFKGDFMSLKTSVWYIAIITVLTILLVSGPVSAADTWIQVDPQDQIIAWETLNAEANMANLYPYALTGTQVPSFTADQGGWKNILYDNQITPGVPGQPSGLPTTSTDLKTIDGTPVSDLFKKAMDNYRVNPPKTLTVPGANETIYSDQIPINWL